MAERRPALGRGLSALIAEAPQPSDLPTEVDLDRLTPNRRQPRAALEGPKLDDLARSIKSSGVIQPILVRPMAAGSYEIVVGERRWRAAQRAGLLRVPVVVRDVPEEKLLELALVENIQREGLNPIEEATAYRQLADEYNLTQDAIAAAVGKDRSSIANYVRLLNPPRRSARRRRGPLALDGACPGAAGLDRRSGAAPGRARGRRPRAVRSRN